MKATTKLFFWRAGGFVATFLPLGLTVGLNHEAFFATRAAGISLTMGGMLAAAIVAIAMIGKGKKIFGSGLVVSGIVFALVWLLEPVILSLRLLTGMLFLGYLLNGVVFAPNIRKWERRAHAAELARAQKEA